MCFDQKQTWEGQFGNEYVKRNLPDLWRVTEAEKVFKSIFSVGTLLQCTTILEVGCGTGVNLLALSQIIPDNKVKLFGVDVNKKALDEAKNQFDHMNADCQLYYQDLDSFYRLHEDETFDLVMTCGVLIHVHPNDLLAFMEKIHTLAERYILCMEYFSHKPVAECYQGKENLLWKRDFGALYLGEFPNLECKSYGFLWQHEYSHFDNINWWLFKKEEK